MGIVTHLTVIGEPRIAACGWTGGYLTQGIAEVTCPECPATWPYAVAARRAAIPAGWRPVSVEPAADFGNGHGLLAVSDSGRADQVIIEQADRTVYVLDEWVRRAAAGEIPWAAIGYVNPWRKVLKVRGADRTVIYEEHGGCGPRVKATLFEQPD
jgi:hypothetical protein